MHFWIIFVRGNKKWGWRAHSDTQPVCAYRTRKEAKVDLAEARERYGEARLYKFKPEAFIFGASK